MQSTKEIEVQSFKDLVNIGMVFRAEKLFGMMFYRSNTLLARVTEPQYSTSIFTGFDTEHHESCISRNVHFNANPLCEPGSRFPAIWKKMLLRTQTP